LSFCLLQEGMVRVEEVIFVISDADSGYGKRNTADSWSGERAGHECVADDGESQAIAATNQITLSITSPANNATVTTATVTVRGKTVPNADVFVNDAQNQIRCER